MFEQMPETKGQKVLDKDIRIEMVWIVNPEERISVEGDEGRESGEMDANQGVVEGREGAHVQWNGHLAQHFVTIF